MALALLAAAFALGIYGGSPIIGGVALAILFLSLATYFLPTNFRIDDQGVAATSVLGARRREWSALRTYVADARGVTLSPYRHTSWLESYRGVRLLFAGNREQVVAAVAARLSPLPRSKRKSEGAHD